LINVGSFQLRNVLPVQSVLSEYKKGQKVVYDPESGSYTF